jgi:ribonuclease HI
VKAKAFIDGSSFGNPGEAGYGVVLLDKNGVTLKSMGEYIGHATNNMAEYRGLKGCLELAHQTGVHSLTVYSDSQLLVRQMQGTYRIKQPHLRELFEEIRQLLDETSIQLQMEHIPREENKKADGLARRAIRLRQTIVE